MIMNMTGGGSSPAEFVQKNGNFDSVTLVQSVELPTSINGVAMNQALNVQAENNIFWQRLVFSAKKLIIPEYYTSAIIQGSFAYPYKAALEEIECYTAGQITTNYYENYVNFHVFRAPNTTKTVKIALRPENFKTVTLHLPKCPTIEPYIGKSPSTSSQPVDIYMVELDADFSSCQTFGIVGGYIYNGKFWTGTVDLPECTKITYTYPEVGEATLYLPKVTQFTNYMMDGASDTGGTAHLYIGPDLTTTGAINANWWQAKGSHIDFHIPPGDTTTKATLDAIGATYTQDYVIE